MGERSVAGVVLAAGAGSRADGAKGLRVAPDGRAWVAIAAQALREAGCEPVLVVLGAQADVARELVPVWAQVVVAEDWSAGQSASLRAGLEAAASGVDGALVTLVDLPGQTAEAGAAVLEAVADATWLGDAGVAAGAGSVAPRAALVRAVHHGQPGHPVYLGCYHWQPLMDELTGDRGAGDYLRKHGAISVECGAGSVIDVDS